MPDHCVTDTRVCSCVGECSGDPQSAECRHLPTHATDTRVCKWPSCTLGDGQVCADCPGLPHATGSRTAVPHVVDCDAGERQWEWHERAFDIEIMVDADGKLISAYIADHQHGFEQEWTA